MYRDRRWNKEHFISWLRVSKPLRVDAKTMVEAGCPPGSVTYYIRLGVSRGLVDNVTRGLIHSHPLFAKP